MCAVLCALVLAACADAPRAAPDSYIVHPQDTLYSIAWRFGLDYRELARWNAVGADYRLSPGQRLRLRPIGGDAAAARRETVTGAGRMPGAERPAGGGATGSGPRTGSGSGSGSGSGTAGASHGAGAGPFRWVWPTDRAGAARPVPGGGILMFGRLGQEVRAAAGGRVVYTGSGLRSYGELVIIRHGDSMLSAYAHNRELLVHEGQEVAAGQAIAHMGDAGHGTAALYFEIRLNGKPVNPLSYLP